MTEVPDSLLEIDAAAGSTEMFIPRDLRLEMIRLRPRGAEDVRLTLDNGRIRRVTFHRTGRWSTTPPTEPGTYWMRGDGPDTPMIPVVVGWSPNPDMGNLAFYETGTRTWVYQRSWPNMRLEWWSERIEEPTK